jgi:hypothetical protein
MATDIHEPVPVARGRCAARRAIVAVAALSGLAGVAGLVACFRRPETTVVVDNDYSAAVTPAPVIYRAYWQTASFGPVAPGEATDAEVAFPTSGVTAYVLLAPGWDPASSRPPTSFVVLQSKAEYAVDLYGTLDIHVDDTTFSGNCAAGSLLSQAQADTITRLVFPDSFAAVRYEAATCRTLGPRDAGAD